MKYPTTLYIAVYTLLHFLAQICFAVPLQVNDTEFHPATSLKKRMTYRDNTINFQQTDGAAHITDFQFTVTDLSITSGQDPKHTNNVGDPYDSPTDFSPAIGSFNFVVGRSASSSVARWFTARVPPSHTSYNRSPGSLNFAFQGAMSIHWNDGKTIALSNFYFAQGNTGTTNDWWIGGDSCVSYGNGNSKVTCSGLTSAGTIGSVDLCRGSGCRGEEMGYGPDWIGVGNRQNF